MWGNSGGERVQDVPGELTIATGEGILVTCGTTAVGWSSFCVPVVVAVTGLVYNFVSRFLFPVLRDDHVMQLLLFPFLVSF